MLNIFHKRQGQMDEGLIYFFTQSIQGRKPLLQDDNMKMVVIDSLKHLTEKGFIELFGYVIMPDHIHLLWKMLKQEKESPAASFSKHTGHQFKRYLENVGTLSQFISGKSDRDCQFWKRDPLAIEISSEKIFFQKLDYTHNNPVKAELCPTPEDYKWSSAQFYQNGYDEFGILTHYVG